jgi:metallo-beta-lactamase family protein
MEWLTHFERPPKRIFLNHGEPHQSDALRVKLQHELGWKVSIPKLNE